MPGDVRVTSRERGTVVAERTRLATNPWSRLLGLMGRRALPAGAGMLLRPCTSVHTCFMRFPIDVLYLNRDLQVVKVVESLRPYRFSWGARGARAVLEVPAGTVAVTGTVVGESLQLESGA